MGRFTLFQPNWEKWIFCLPAQQNEFCLHVAGKIHILLRHPMSCRFMLNSIFLAFFWTLFLGKKNGKNQPLLVRQCQIPLFSAKIPVFLTKKKTCLVHFLGWTTPFLRENKRLASSSTASSKGSAAKPASCCCNLGMVSDQGPMRVEFYPTNVDTLG